MIPYWILLLVPLSLVLKKNDGKIKQYGSIEESKNEKAVFSFFLIFLILLCFRGIDCGNDLRDYLYITNRNINLTYIQILKYYKTEQLYHLFNKFVYSVFGNYSVYIAIVSIISIVPIYFFYKRESALPYMSIVLFVTVAPFSMYFSGLRQILAMALSVPAYYFSVKKRLVPFIIIVLIASFFHFSAFIALALYPLVNLRFKKDKIWIIAFAMAVVYIFNNQIFTFLFNEFGDVYSNYKMQPTGAFGTLAILVVFCVISVVLPQNNAMDAKTFGLRNILFFSTCLQCFAPLQSVAMRLNYYYLLFVPVAISRILICVKPNNKKIATVAILVIEGLFLLYFFIRAYSGEDILKIFPYMPFWEEQL